MMNKIKDETLLHVLSKVLESVQGAELGDSSERPPQAIVKVGNDIIILSISYDSTGLLPALLVKDEALILAMDGISKKLQMPYEESTEQPRLHHNLSVLSFIYNGRHIINYRLIYFGDTKTQRIVKEIARRLAANILSSEYLYLIELTPTYKLLYRNVATSKKFSILLDITDYQIQLTPLFNIDMTEFHQRIITAQITGVAKDLNDLHSKGLFGK